MLAKVSEVLICEKETNPLPSKEGKSSLAINMSPAMLAWLSHIYLIHRNVLEKALHSCTQASPHLPCTGTGPTHLWQKMPVICQTELLLQIEEKELVLLKRKYLPATPDKILTLRRSAGLSAKGVLTLVVQCTDDISKVNANMQHYAFKEVFFNYFSHKL